MTDRFVPDYRIELDGEPISAALRASISDVSLTSALKGADRVEFSVANQYLQWTDNNLFRNGTSVKLHLGYNGEGFEQMFVGEIVSTQASFPASGQPTLTIAAQDRMERMRGQVRSTWYAVPIPMIGTVAVPDAAVASLISLENGFLPIMDPFGAILSVLLDGASVAVAIGDTHALQKLVRKQQGESDLDFAAKIAAENGWEMFVEHSGDTGGYKLRFLSPEGELAPVRTYHYGSSLVDWSPRITSVGVIASVTAYLRVSAIKTVFEVTAGYDWDSAALELSIRPSIFGVLPPSEGTRIAGDNEKYLILSENLTVVTAPRRILNKLISSLNQRITGTGTVVGDPSLIAGKVVQMEGLGEEFGGRYRITTATHSFGGGGYSTNFEARKEIWFGSIPAPDQGAFAIKVPFAEVSAGTDGLSAGVGG